MTYTPQQMVDDLTKKIEFFENNRPRDKKTGEVLIVPQFAQQLNMLKDMKKFISDNLPKPQTQESTNENSSINS